MPAWPSGPSIQKPDSRPVRTPTLACGASAHHRLITLSSDVPSLRPRGVRPCYLDRLRKPREFLVPADVNKTEHHGQERRVTYEDYCSAEDELDPDLNPGLMRFFGTDRARA